MGNHGHKADAPPFILQLVQLLLLMELFAIPSSRAADSESFFSLRCFFFFDVSGLREHKCQIDHRYHRDRPNHMAAHYHHRFWFIRNTRLRATRSHERVIHMNQNWWWWWCTYTYHQLEYQHSKCTVLFAHISIWVCMRGARMNACMLHLCVCGCVCMCRKEKGYTICILIFDNLFFRYNVEDTITNILLGIARKMFHAIC